MNGVSQFRVHNLVVNAKLSLDGNVKNLVTFRVLTLAVLNLRRDSKENERWFDKTKNSNFPTRYCAIKTCTNNTATCPLKIFICTKISKRAASWFPLVKPETLTNSHFYVCEDHFDLKNDAANWSSYRAMPQTLRLKRGILPHRFLQEPSNIPQNYSQLKYSNYGTYGKHQKVERRVVNFINCSKYENPNHNQMEMETDPLSISNEEITQCDDSIDMRNIYDLLELTYSPETNNEESNEVTENNQVNLEEITMDNHEEEVDTYLKYLGIKLRRINDDDSYYKTEMEILKLVQTCLNEIRDKENVHKTNWDLLMVIKNDHNYGKVPWID